jgi:hypothetical protein
MHQLEKLSLFLTSMSLEKNQIFFSRWRRVQHKRNWLGRWNVGPIKLNISILKIRFLNHLYQTSCNNIKYRTTKTNCKFYNWWIDVVRKLIKLQAGEAWQIRPRALDGMFLEFYYFTFFRYLVKSIDLITNIYSAWRKYFQFLNK